MKLFIFLFARLFSEAVHDGSLRANQADNRNVGFSPWRALVKH